MTESPLQQFTALRVAAPKRKLVGTLFLAVVIQVLLVSLTVFVVVFVPSQKEDPEFVSKKSIYLPQRELEHKMAVAEFQQAAQSPMQMEKIQVDRMTPTSMPQLPEMPSMEFTPVAPDTPSPVGAALFGNSGVGGMMDGLAGDASSISFLGIEDSAKRVVFLFDISVTVVNSVEAAGLSMLEIRDEMIHLIEQLNANTLFGMIQHSRNFDIFQPTLIPATVGNKEAAVEWLRSEFRTDGSGRGWSRYEGENGVTAVLEVAFNMDPDVIFVLSDGGYWRSDPNQRIPYDEIHNRIEARQDQLVEEARIHVIGFGVDPRDRKGFSGIAGKNDGKYRTFD